jgi:hypothetical protein
MYIISVDMYVYVCVYVGVYVGVYVYIYIVEFLFINKNRDMMKPNMNLI